MGETLKCSYIPMDWVTVDVGILMELRQYVPIGDPKDM